MVVTHDPPPMAQRGGVRCGGEAAQSGALVEADASHAWRESLNGWPDFFFFFAIVLRWGEGAPVGSGAPFLFILIGLIKTRVFSLSASGFGLFLVVLSIYSVSWRVVFDLAHRLGKPMRRCEYELQPWKNALLIRSYLSSFMPGKKNTGLRRVAFIRVPLGIEVEKEMRSISMWPPASQTPTSISSHP